jgi:hypothetical protein
MGAGLLLLAVSLFFFDWSKSDRQDGNSPQLQPHGQSRDEGPTDTPIPPVPVETDPFEEPNSEKPTSEQDAGTPAKPRAGILVSKKSPEAGLLHGIWTKGDGSAAEGRRLRIHRVSDLGLSDAQMVVATKTDGAYEAWLEAGTWRAVFEGTEYALEMPAKGERKIDHRDLPDTAATLRVRISGADLQPWNALVSVTVAADGLHQVSRMRTGTDGVAVMERMRPGKAEVKAQIHRISGGRPILSHAVVEIPETGVAEVVLRQPAGRLTVYVMDASTNAPIPGATVDYRPQGVRRPSGSGVTAESGRCRIDGLPLGAGTLSVSHPDYAPGRVTVSVSDKGGEAQTALHRGFSIPVEAIAHNGNPMMVILRGTIPGESPPRVWEWRLNEEGQGVMDRLPYEDLSMEILSAGCEPIVVRTADLRAAGSFRAIFKPLASASK